MIEKYITTIAVAVLAASMFSGCSKKEDNASALSVMSEVKYIHPQKRAVDIWDEYTARIESIASVELRARVNGYLQKINFKDGEYVKEGDLLFVIDPRPYEASAAAARAALKEVEARLILAKSNMTRAKELYAANAISKEILETRNSELLSAEAALMNAQAVLREAELNLEYTHIRAPMSGRVSETFVDIGNLITANSTLLTTIIKNDIVQVYFEISERDYLNYVKNGVLEQIDMVKKTGPEVEFRLTLEGGKVFKGILNYYDNRIGQETSSLTLRADFDNKDGRLLPGMFGKVRMRASASAEAIIIPEQIIGTDLVNRYVVVIDENNVARYRAVKVGRLYGKYRIIEEGLSPSDRVVAQGLHRANPGSKVIPSELKEGEPVGDDAEKPAASGQGQSAAKEATQAKPEKQAGQSNASAK